MKVRAVDILPGDRLGGRVAAMVLPGDARRWTTVACMGGGLLHFRPESEVRVQR